MKISNASALRSLAAVSLIAATLAPALPAFGDEPRDQVIGFYSRGSLSKATALSDEGKGILHLFRERNRPWGSFGLVNALERIAAEIADQHPDGERLQIGDLSAEAGGPITRHASHQNGLDADLVYFRTNRQEQRLDQTNGFIEQFVIKGKLSPNFDIERNWLLMKLLVATGKVNRIFADPVIKKTLCQHAAAKGEFSTQTETLRRLRPYPNHADHLHLRFKCPANSPRCISQVEVPAGDGCSEVKALESSLSAVLLHE